VIKDDSHPLRPLDALGMQREGSARDLEDRGVSPPCRSEGHRISTHKGRRFTTLKASQAYQKLADNMGMV